MQVFVSCLSGKSANVILLRITQHHIYGSVRVRVSLSIVLKWLESRQIIIIDWHRITFGLSEEKDLIQQADTLVYSLIDTGALGIAAITGFTAVRRFFK